MTAHINLLKDKPLSSYSLVKHEPIVIRGLVKSLGNLRLKAVTTLKAGTTYECTKYGGQKTAAADQVYANARPTTESAPPAFGTSSAPSAFGGTTTTAFGKPAFGQSALAKLATQSDYVCIRCNKLAHLRVRTTFNATHFSVGGTITTNINFWAAISANVSIRSTLAAHIRFCTA
ncbi:hypothetical protein OG21DRAFT_1499831 [Imleria badia]|nr:hypothetical protein OG21DRAFT_1499831 [Imleria badia]